MDRLAVRMRANPAAAAIVPVGEVPIVLDDDCEVSFYECC